MKTLKDYPLQSLSTQELSQIEGGIIPTPPNVVIYALINLLLGGGGNND